MQEYKDMKIRKYLNLAVAFFAWTALFLPSAAKNQQPPQTPEQQEKQFTEMVDKEVKRLTDLLDLEYWQEFYVDSILTHDLHARMEEIQSMQKAKVENTDLYMAVSDKWMQKIDDAYKRFFTQEQWDKYWKTTGRRAQKERDKRKNNTI